MLLTVFSMNRISAVNYLLLNLQLKCFNCGKPCRIKSIFQIPHLLKNDYALKSYSTSGQPAPNDGIENEISDCELSTHSDGQKIHVTDKSRSKKIRITKPNTSVVKHLSTFKIPHHLKNVVLAAFQEKETSGLYLMDEKVARKFSQFI